MCLSIMIDFRALTVHRPVQTPLLSQFFGCSLNEKQALGRRFLAVLHCLRSREFRGLHVWHSCTPPLWHLNGRRRLLHPAAGNLESPGNQRNFGVHKPNGRHITVYNNENGHFNGSSSKENGFGLPAEGADPFILSVATDSFATKLQDDFVEVQKSAESRSRQQSLSGSASIKVFGVGGGGCNAVNEMVRSDLLNVEFWAVNTDAQALSRSLAPNKIQIGRDTTQGRGAGGKSATGEESATESLAELSMALEGADLVFIACGMGGGTGSGASPVVARLAKAMGALTIGIVTEPFRFEGQHRAREARKAIEAMRHAADTVVIVPNDRLLQTVAQDTSMLEAFHLADDVLRQGVQGISDIITVPGLVNVDFADVKAIMSNAGSAMLGIGAGFGKNRAEEVARSAIMSPLLRSISRPMGIVYNVTGGSDLTLHEVNVAAEIVYSMADPNANVIFGAVIDETYKGMVRMTVIATGFRDQASMDSNATGSIRTIDDDIFYWKQNPKQANLDNVPEILRRNDVRRIGNDR